MYNCTCGGCINVHIVQVWIPAEGAGEAGLGDGGLEAGQAQEVAAGQAYRLVQDGQADRAHHLGEWGAYNWAKFGF